ncbi:rhodanese-like domain-containing protein [Jannaschia rubra]|uniref:Rhodanese domain-containing protein n=1 Tax=Jannaschia rubra TaxID=282197 RepID=A0A0M6XMC4_9RHOB|nr:hypothetical protein [Jannaschia rubra]CTQ32340.1 hypothetical protein JAN5088_01105 [Jannaschia rubra]SFG46732.1 Rhodanese-related sulfurtransferase [Jannaschia rubra]
MDHAFITPDRLFPRLHLPDAPVVFDVRRDDDATTDPTRLPGAQRLTLSQIESAPVPDRAVVYCQKGGKISQLGADALRRRGGRALVLAGGHLGWVAAGLPVQALPPPSARWIVPLDPGASELAALWVLRRLVDRAAPLRAVGRDQVGAACTVWEACALPGTAKEMARLAALDHPIVDNLSLPLFLERLLAGRRRRGVDAEASLDLIDDWLAGARR